MISSLDTFLGLLSRCLVSVKIVFAASSGLRFISLINPRKLYPILFCSFSELSQHMFSYGFKNNYVDFLEKKHY